MHIMLNLMFPLIFKKLYTNLPHNKEIETISDLVNIWFIDSSKVEFINVDSKFKASWSSN